MKYLAAILLTISTAHAGPVVVTWDLATERENGAPLDISEIEGTNLRFGLDGSVWGPFILEVDFLSLPLNIDEDELCLKLSTVLFDGSESSPTDRLCMTNTPKEGG